MIFLNYLPQCNGPKYFKKEAISHPNPDLRNRHCLPAVGRRVKRSNPVFFNEIATPACRNA
jgi:hypothetical protein